MRLEALGAGKRHGGGGQAFKGTLVKAQNGGALHEVEHAQAGGETGTACRRQDVVGARHIVADHFGCVGAQEDRPGVADPCRDALRIRGCDFDMLGGNAVGERRSVGEGAKHDDRSEGLPAGPGDVAARQSGKLALDGRQGGPYRLNLSIVEDRLAFAVAQEGSDDAFTFVLSLTPLRRIMRDYFVVCESYYQAIRTAPPSRIQSIDMGRRALHDEGSNALMERLKGKITVDRDTARRLFTLICALHWKG